MPKQIIEINPFHGGLNNNSDPRDIKIEELSEAQDIMVDEVGIVRMMGGRAAHESASRTVTAEPGYGLFYFAHDRLGAQDARAGIPSYLGAAEDEAQTGDHYLALANSDAGADIEIYSNSDTSWSSGSPRPIVLGDGSSTTGLKAVYYYSDGNLRVGDAGLSSDKRVKWFGYIDRYFYGDATTGYDVVGTRETYRINQWWTENSNPVPLQPKSVTAQSAGVAPTDDKPVTIDLQGQAGIYTWGAEHGIATVETDTLALQGNWSANAFTEAAAGNPKYTNFAAIGDTIIFSHTSAANGVNNKKLFTIKEVTDSVMTFNEDVPDHDDDNDPDHCIAYNLSKSAWFDSDNPNFELAISTLYDDAKQESALHKLPNSTLTPVDFIRQAVDEGGSVPSTKTHAEVGGFQKIKIDFWLYRETDSGNNIGLHNKYPRVSGFKIYMRREGTTDSPTSGDWFLQAEVDVTKGNRNLNNGDYTQWIDTSSDYQAGGVNMPKAPGIYMESMRQVETYETETGFSPNNYNIGFNADGLGFKTAVIANRRCYVGNVKIKDEQDNIQTLPDAIIKSPVNSFDSFSIDDRMEVSIRDGDEIVKLETYADRLLEFKKNKMTIINISQSIEFVEDVFMFKGVTHPCSVARSDYGTVWANERGCYLYDGKQVTDLLEKKGLQVIKESFWSSFIGAIPMVGYVPKKRQIIVVKTAGSEGKGNIFLYDLVTQSWVQGDSKYEDDEKQTNFVVDWNDDLINGYYHDGTSTTYLKKWDDSSQSGNMIFSTKDMTFGQPGQRKKLHKVYITYKGDGSGVTSTYAVNGDDTTYKTFSSSLENKSSATDWTLAELKPSSTSDSNNIYSAKFRLNGASVASDFKINDINVVFRMKNVK